MKQHILPAIRLTLVCIVCFMIVYPGLIWTIAKVAPAHGEGETIAVNNKVVGWKLIGQKFTGDKYFQSRPSAVDYNATGSGGSNKSSSNPDYLKEVRARVDSFLVHNPSIKKEDIPSELVTASGSGLDPDISITAARIQVKRIASVRNISEESIQQLVDRQKQQPFLGLFGQESINVLQLNIALDNIK